MRSGLPRRVLRAGGLAALLLLPGGGAGTAWTAGAAWAAGPAKTPPAPVRWVTDGAGLLSPQARQALDAQLEDYQRRTGHQVLVWIGDSTGVIPIEDFASAAFQAWRVGRKGIDDGLVLFVMAKDRKLRFEVGYGLEPRLPDIIASRIIREVIAPRLRAGDADGAVAAGVAAASAAIDGRDWLAAGGVPSAGGTPPGEGVSPGAEEGRQAASARERVLQRAHRLSLPQMILLGILGLAFLFFLVTHPTFALWLLFNILSGGRGGGGGGGGGGFSGGGGRSGGGGASGSW